MTTRAVSVVLPTYNRAGLLGEAIASVLGQSFTDLELIVVDDGSTDETPAVVGAISDGRVHYLRQENRGVAGACNTGIRAAQGKYVAFLGSDDRYLPEALATLHLALEVQPEVGLVACGWRAVDEKGIALREIRPWLSVPQLGVTTWLLGCPFGTGMILVRREWLERVGGFNEAIGSAEDCDLGLRLAYAGCRMAYVEEILMEARVLPGNLTQDVGKIRHGALTSLDNFYAQDGLPDELRTIRNHIYAVRYLRIAALEYAVKQVAQAQQDMDQAVALDPSLLDNSAEAIVRILVDTALNVNVVKHPEPFLRTAAEHLPETVAGAGLLRKALAALHTQQFFEAHRARNWPAVRRYALAMLLDDPGRLLDRGVVSVVLEAFVGTSVARRIRNLVRRSTPKATSADP